jgi:hypothetical protein
MVWTDELDELAEMEITVAMAVQPRMAEKVSTVEMVRLEMKAVPVVTDKTRVTAEMVAPELMVRMVGLGSMVFLDMMVKTDELAFLDEMELMATMETVVVMVEPVLLAWMVVQALMDVMVELVLMVLLAVMVVMVKMA